MDNNEVLIQMKIRSVDKRLIQTTRKHLNLFFPQIWNNALHKFCDDVEEKIVVFDEVGARSESISELEAVVKRFRNSDFCQDSEQFSNKESNSSFNDTDGSVLLPRSKRLSLVSDYLDKHPKATPTSILRWSKKEKLNLGSMNTIRRQVKEVRGH